MPESTTKEAGKIITAEDAQRKFGNISANKGFSLEELTGYLEKTQDSIMFCLRDGRLNILGDKRKAIATSFSIDAEEVYTRYSISKIKELIEKASSEKVITFELQLRGDKLMIQAGSIVLEYGEPCPPNC